MMKLMKKNLADNVAKIISFLLNPLFVPSYMLLILLYADSAFALYPPQFKIYLIWVVVLYTLIIPAISLGILRTAGRISSFDVDNRDERALPLLLAGVCYILCAMTIGRIHSAELLRRIMLASACCQIMALAVSFRWKISLHMIAQGGCVAILLVLSLASIGNLTSFLALAVVAAGILASSRLYLGKHSPWQVAAGFLGGFVVALSMMLLL